MTWRHVAHTADVALEVDAASFEELCAAAAAALMALLVADPSAGGAPAARTVRLPAAAEEELLHGWLSALLLAFELDGWVTDHAAVRRAGGGLEGELHGAPFDRQRHGGGTEVKAVTWHGLRVERVGARWHGWVLVDL